MITTSLKIAIEAPEIPFGLKKNSENRKILRIIIFMIFPIVPFLILIQLQITKTQLNELLSIDERKKDCKKEILRLAKKKQLIESHFKGNLRHQKVIRKILPYHTSQKEECFFYEQKL